MIIGPPAGHGQALRLGNRSNKRIIRRDIEIQTPFRERKANQMLREISSLLDGLTVIRNPQTAQPIPKIELARTLEYARGTLRVDDAECRVLRREKHAAVLKRQELHHRIFGSRDIDLPAATAILPAADLESVSHPAGEQIAAVGGPTGDEDVRTAHAARIRGLNKRQVLTRKQIDGGPVLIADGDTITVRREYGRVRFVPPAPLHLGDWGTVLAGRVEPDETVKRCSNEPALLVEIRPVGAVAVSFVAGQQLVSASDVVDADAVADQ